MVNFYKSGIPIGTRPSNHTPDIMGTNEEPWMTRESINYIYNYINCSNNTDTLKLLEYGCGSSTAYFLSLGLKVSSIEHNKIWLDDLKSKLDDTYLNNWYPYLISNQSEGNYEGSDGEFYDDYVNKINDLNNFDIIIIDGRCRSQCIINSINKLNKGGLFIVDNAERKKYNNAIKNYIPTDWKKNIFSTKVDTTIVWEKPI